MRVYMERKGNASPCAGLSNKKAGPRVKPGETREIIAWFRRKAPQGRPPARSDL